MMTNDELDRILSSKDDNILPSSGLAGSVMEAIRSEAITPPPIPFPWKRALPGLAAAAVALVGLLTLLLDQLLRSAVTQPLMATWPAGWVPIVQATGWSVLALLLSMISVKFSMRLASR
jgi:hypothetical protein